MSWQRESLYLSEIAHECLGCETPEVGATRLRCNWLVDQVPSYCADLRLKGDTVGGTIGDRLTHVLRPGSGSAHGARVGIIKVFVDVERQLHSEYILRARFSRITQIVFSSKNERISVA